MQLYIEQILFPACCLMIDSFTLIDICVMIDRDILINISQSDYALPVIIIY